MLHTKNTFHLRLLPLPVRLGLSAFIAVLLAGWCVSLTLAAKRGTGRIADLLTPEATRIRACAPPLERAIHTTMRRHIPSQRERDLLVAWMRRGARMRAYFQKPSRIIEQRCATCHGATAQGGIRLMTYGDALSLVSVGGRDPYKRLARLHVHLFAIGTVLVLLFLGLTHTRFPERLTVPLGLLPLAALLVSVPVTLWGCSSGAGGATVLWLCDGLVTLSWPIVSGLLLWDLYAPRPQPAAQKSAPS